MVCGLWIKKLSSEEKDNLRPAILQSSSPDDLIKYVEHHIGKEIIVTYVKTMKTRLAIG